MFSAVEFNHVSILRSALEDQDRSLLSACAQKGTPDTAHYLLSRLPPTVKISSEDSAGHLTSTPEAAYLGTHIFNPSPTHHALLYLLKESAQNGNVAVFRALAVAHPEFLATKNRNIESLFLNAISGGVKIWEVILSYHPRYVNYEFSRHGGSLLEVVVRSGGLSNYYPERTIKEGKEEAWETLKYLLQQGADTERAGDPVLERLRIEKAEKRVIEEVARWSAKNRADGMC